MGETFYLVNPGRQEYLVPNLMNSFTKYPWLLYSNSMPERLALLTCQFEGSDKLPSHLVWTQELLSTWSSQEIVVWGDFRFEDQVLAVREQGRNRSWSASAMAWEHDLSGAYACFKNDRSNQFDPVINLGRSPHLEPFRTAAGLDDLPAEPPPVAVLQAVTRLLGYPAFYVVNQHTRQKIKLFEYRQRETLFPAALAKFAEKLLSDLLIAPPSNYRDHHDWWFDDLRGCWSQHALWVRPQPPIEQEDPCDYEDITTALSAEWFGFWDLFDVDPQDPVCMRLIGKILDQPHNKGFRKSASDLLGCDWRAAYQHALHALYG